MPIQQDVRVSSRNPIMSYIIRRTIILPSILLRYKMRKGGHRVQRLAFCILFCREGIESIIEEKDEVMNAPFREYVCLLCTSAQPHTL